MNYDPTTDIGRVRLLVADTDEESFDFTDEEIEAAMEMTETLPGAAAMLLRSLAANRARLAVSVKRGIMSEDLRSLARELRELADDLQGREDEEMFGVPRHVVQHVVPEVLERR